MSISTPIATASPSSTRTTSGSTAQLGHHLARALDNGATEDELKEVITHLAFYAGWPKAMSAMTVAKDVFQTR